jgi:hypothetical protein
MFKSRNRSKGLKRNRGGIDQREALLGHSDLAGGV